MRDIGIEELQPGMMIIAISAQNGPVRIRKSGMVSSWPMVQGLKEMGVQRLQIDPAQSVEIDSSTSDNGSPMQQLINQPGRSAIGQIADGQLHEQFNRSLFLPSVSGLHSRWRHYVRQGSLWTLLIVGGVAIGFTVATPQRWIAAWQSEPVIHQPVVAIAMQPAQHKSVAANTTKPAAGEQHAKPQDAVTPVSQSAGQTGQPVKSYAEMQQQQPQVAVPPDLVKKFNQAVEEMSNKIDSQPDHAPAKEKLNMPDIKELPVDVRRELPKMSFSAHMYASEPDNRWVRMNGRELHEGDWINSDLQLQHITPQQVILSFRGQQFSMDALSDW